MSTLRVSEQDVRTERARVPWLDLQLVLASGALLFALIILDSRIPVLHPLQAVLGLAWVLFVPGYCLLSALFAQADELDAAERVGASIGLSVALVPFLALLLDQLPWGIRVGPIVLSELATTCSFIAVAFWRRIHLPPELAYAPQLRLLPRLWWRWLNPSERRICALLFASLLLGTLAGLWAVASPSPSQYTTEFYVRGKQGLAEDYPRAVAPGHTVTVTVSIVNKEQRQKTYRVTVWQEPDPFGKQRQLLKAVGPFTLAASQRIDRLITWRMTPLGDNQLVQLQLEVDGKQQAYRQLQLWLNVRNDL